MAFEANTSETTRKVMEENFVNVRKKCAALRNAICECKTIMSKTMEEIFDVVVRDEVEQVQLRLFRRVPTLKEALEKHVEDRTDRYLNTFFFFFFFSFLSLSFFFFWGGVG